MNDNNLELELELELEYDFIEEKNSNILSSNDIQDDILKLLKLSENDCLYTLSPEEMFKNSDSLEKYKEFNSLARNIFNYIYDGHNEYLNVMKNLIILMRYYDGLEKTLLSYCLLDILSEYDSQLANKIFKSFVTKYGAWKDLKRFYIFCYCLNKECTSTVINYSITLANDQLRHDLNNPSNNISNVAKWIPRENFKHTKLYERLAKDFFKEYFINDDDELKKNQLTKNQYKKNQYKKALTKAKMNYRKCLAKLNKKLDTVQIKQCSKNWQKINPAKQTYRTLELQTNAFLNLKNDDEMRYELSDRIICANNFIENINDKIKKKYFSNSFNYSMSFNELLQHQYSL
jgi:hypothetical protein